VLGYCLNLVREDSWPRDAVWAPLEPAPPPTFRPSIRIGYEVGMTVLEHDHQQVGKDGTAIEKLGCERDFPARHATKRQELY
jgi:hypothetical protein